MFVEKFTYSRLSVSCFFGTLQLSTFNRFLNLSVDFESISFQIQVFFFSQISLGGPLPYIVLTDSTCAISTKKIGFLNFRFFPVFFAKLFFTIIYYKKLFKKLHLLLNFFHYEIIKDFSISPQSLKKFFFFNEKSS